MKIQLTVPEEIRAERLLAYSRFYQLEIWLRELVYLELKANFGGDWWVQAEKALKRSKTRYIPPEKSLKADKKHPHMSTPETDPLWFLSFDSLLKVIFDKNLWRIFQTYLTTKKLLRAKFEEISPIRNRIAHSRSLHTDDVGRIERVLRDLDKGFWKFCTSYNHDRPFIAHLQRDPVYRHFADREHVRYVEVEPNTWALVGSRIHVQMDMMLRYSVRPSRTPRRIPKVSLTKGAVYDFTFSTAHKQRAMDYPRILDKTKSVHDSVVHIFLDSFQYMLRVTFPARIQPKVIINATEAFYEACSRYYTFSYRDTLTKKAPKKGDYFRQYNREYREVNRYFERIAAEWPHYVVPPSYPFAFLCPDNPCNFFGA